MRVRLGSLSFGLLKLVELRSQQRYREPSILVLTSFYLTGYDDTTRNVKHTNSTFSLVNVLSTCTLTSHCRDLQVGWVDFNTGLLRVFLEVWSDADEVDVLQSRIVRSHMRMAR